MNWPTFLVVGAARAGTTTLYTYLKRHPEVYMTQEKEPCFFAFANEVVKYKKGNLPFIKTKVGDYQRLFEGSDKFTARGEASTPYLYFYSKTISNIKKFHPDPENLKIIIILRNPVDRAFSQFMMKVRNAGEDLTFEEAIDFESQRMKENYSFDYFYADKGFYYRQVKAYFDNFSHVKVWLYEDLVNSPENLMGEIYKFIGVSPDIEIGNRRLNYNVSGEPKIKFVNRILASDSRIVYKVKSVIPRKIVIKLKEFFIKHSLNEEKKSLSGTTRRELIEIYSDDFKKLAGLIDRDLSSWMT